MAAIPPRPVRSVRGPILGSASRSPERGSPMTTTDFAPARTAAPAPHYDRLQRLFHWSMALIIIAALLRTAVPDASEFAVMAAQISVYLAVFNLLPVPPLDGSKMLIALRVPYTIYIELARFGFILLLLAFYYTPLGTWINYTSLTITSEMFQLTRVLL